LPLTEKEVVSTCTRDGSSSTPNALRAQGYSREQARNVVGVEPIERTAQTIVVEIGRLDARNIQQTLQGLVLEELGDQVEPSVTEAQAV